MMALAGALAVGAGVAGLYPSYYAGTAAGASIAAAAALTYVVSFAFGLRGLRVHRARPRADASAGSGYAGAT